MSPRRAEQNEQLREESKMRIIESALTLFASHGYEQTSIRMIARRAGIAQGLLYNYFAGKEQLLHEIFARSVADVRESFARAEASGEPGERIERLIRVSFALIREHMAFWRLSYGVRMQATVLAGLGDLLQEWTGEIRGTLERYFHEAGASNPAIEAIILFALLDGIAQHFVLDPEHYPLDEVTEQIVARYCR